MTDLTYAKVGGPPDDWAQLQVRDLDSGELLDGVVEVNSAEGWADLMDRSAYKPGMDHVPLVRVDGRFAIERQGQ
jgi:hypothetical protein